jgi:hypothetical protein
VPWSWVVQAFLMCSLASAQAPPCRITAHLGPIWEVANGLTGRWVASTNDGPRTVQLGPGGKLTGYQWGEEFRLRLEGGREVLPRDFAWAEPTKEAVGSGLALVLSGEGKGVPLRARLAYTVLPGRPWLWKRISLQATDDGVVVRDVQVEEAKVADPSAKADLGGFGQPVFLSGKAFWGLEFPAAENLQRDGLVTLTQHPGVRLETDRWWTSYPAAFGMAEGADAATAFRRYLAEIRRPPRSYVVYNSWYDVQRGEMSVPVLLERARQLHEELTVKRGAPFDAVALDDGWQDRQSIWEIDPKGFPQGFRELHDGLKAMGVSIGLWHPLTAMRYNLDTDWGAQNGYEVSPDKSFFCLSGPRYNAALRDELRRHTREYEIDYFKHDFNAFDCAGEGHGHLPEAPYGREANVRAETGMFDFLSRIRPGVYLNPSGGMWLSPWWLKYVDTVWMQHCDDFGYNRRVVAWEPRDWEMTYRDTALYRNLHIDRSQFPVSAIMTIGIIDGKLNRLGGDHEPLDRWANNVMVNVGRGSMLKELYITPSLLSAKQWDVLASALKWQQQFVPQMAAGRMLPVDPQWDQVYGWVHVNADGGFVCLRNPGMVAKRATVDLPELGRTGVQALRVYPWRETIPVAGPPGAPRLTTEVEPYGVTVVELRPEGTVREPVIAGARSSVVARKPGEIVYDAWGAPGTTAEVAARLPGGRIESVAVAGAVALPPKTSVHLRFRGTPYHLWHVSADETGRQFGVTVDEGVSWCFLAVAHGLPKSTELRLIIDGKPAEAQRVPGEGWELFSCPVPEGEHKVAWATAPEPTAPGPFEAPSYDVQPYFVREAPLAAVRVTVRYDGPGEPSRAAPETPCAGIGRSTWIGPKVAVAPAGAPVDVAVSAEDLRQARAAKLHVMVFGSQGGEDYGRKWIVLNGERMGAVPVNSNAAQPDTWEGFVIDLTPDQTRRLRLENEIVIERQTGDCFKLADLALAVQRPDGRWAETNHDSAVWCSAPGWLFDEGKHFGDRTPPIQLQFRAR